MGAQGNFSEKRKMEIEVKKKSGQFGEMGNSKHSRRRKECVKALGMNHELSVQETGKKPLGLTQSQRIKCKEK